MSSEEELADWRQSFLSTVLLPAWLRAGEQGKRTSRQNSVFFCSVLSCCSFLHRSREGVVLVLWMIFWRTSATSPKEASYLAQPAQCQACHWVWHSCGDSLNGKVKTSLLGEDLQSAVSFKMLKLTFLAIFLIEKETWLKDRAHIGLFLEPGKFIKFFHHHCFRRSCF